MQLPLGRVSRHDPQRHRTRAEQGEARETEQLRRQSHPGSSAAIGPDRHNGRPSSRQNGAGQSHKMPVSDDHHSAPRKRLRDVHAGPSAVITFGGETDGTRRDDAMRVPLTGVAAACRADESSESAVDERAASCDRARATSYSTGATGTRPQVGDTDALSSHASRS
jgi:hypothetical protein